MRLGPEQAEINYSGRDRRGAWEGLRRSGRGMRVAALLETVLGFAAAAAAESPSPIRTSNYGQMRDRRGEGGGWRT